MLPPYFSAPIAPTAPPCNDEQAVFALHRIDAPHIPTADSTPETQICSREQIASENCPSDDFASQASRGFDSADSVADDHESTVIDFDPAIIRAAHADDLIEYLQRWSEELDQRSSRLHADMATHERRERAFRLWMQNRQLELDSQIHSYRQAQANAEAIARRIALADRI